jgi:hypothetical protein
MPFIPPLSAKLWWKEDRKMPTLDFLKALHAYGYDSGNVLSIIPSRRRLREELTIGGSYRRVFKAAALPYLNPDARVLELGPGRGSWSRAILHHLPQLHTVDFLDVSRWLEPTKYDGRLVCHQVSDNSMRDIPPTSILIFFGHSESSVTTINQISVTY